MKRLKLFILLFFTALTVPIGYFIFQTYQGLERVESARLRFFAETIFDEMENELLDLAHTEENRLVDEYNGTYMPNGIPQGSGKPVSSPLSVLPDKDYILGYFQNNPDGSFHTPLTLPEASTPAETSLAINELQSINDIFNPMRSKAATVNRQPVPKAVKKKETKAQSDFESPYLDRSKKKSKYVSSAKRQSRVQEISEEQALRLSRQSAPQEWTDEAVADVEMEEDTQTREKTEPMALAGSIPESPTMSSESHDLDFLRTFQVEIAPLQSVIVSDDRVFLFRRVVIGEAIYRQGFVIKLKAFAKHIADAHFSQHPIARYAALRIDVIHKNGNTDIARFGTAVERPVFTHQRGFSFPFNFLSVNLSCSSIPHSENRRMLGIMMLIFLTVFLLGFLAIYQSARTVIDLSERRSRFVSSVTHELKTPLTNIRMYIEMLEQGMARDPEREQTYFGVLNRESARLSQLINNVLELSRLENRQRRLSMQEGDLVDVFREVEMLMGETVHQAGFTLRIEKPDVGAFSYDAQIVTLILINLIENSIKFGKDQALKSILVKTWAEKTTVNISVTDTGPGIPRNALKKVFTDFYRVEDALTRKTSGTGIGLSLVKKFVSLMNGNVSARNNEGPGCTITVSLPV